MGPDVAAHHVVAKREGMSLSAATVALVSVDGAPASAAADFDSALVEAAKSRDIVMVDASSARYLVRGYLSAMAVEGGAQVEYVWDVFGPDKHRAFRLNDVMAIKGAGDDPWTVVTPAALASVAAKSADDLAAFLSNSPEAKPVAQASPSSPTTTLSYAAAN